MENLNMETIRQSSLLNTRRKGTATSTGTEREGFEPSVRDKTYTRLAGERLRPLGHLSVFMRITDSIDSFSCAQRCRYMLTINLNIRVLTIEIENDFQFHL